MRPFVQHGSQFSLHSFIVRRYLALWFIFRPADTPLQADIHVLLEMTSTGENFSTFVCGGT